MRHLCLAMLVLASLFTWRQDEQIGCGVYQCRVHQNEQGDICLPEGAVYVTPVGAEFFCVCIDDGLDCGWE